NRARPHPDAGLTVDDLPRRGARCAVGPRCAGGPRHGLRAPAAVDAARARRTQPGRAYRGAPAGVPGPHLVGQPYGFLSHVAPTTHSAIRSPMISGERAKEKWFTGLPGSSAPLVKVNRSVRAEGSFSISASTAARGARWSPSRSTTSTGRL